MLIAAWALSRGNEDLSGETLGERCTNNNLICRNACSIQGNKIMEIYLHGMGQLVGREIDYFTTTTGNKNWISHIDVGIFLSPDNLNSAKFLSPNEK